MILLAESEGTEHAQSDLGLRCPHLLEDTFSQGAVPIMLFMVT